MGIMELGGLCGAFGIIVPFVMLWLFYQWASIALDARKQRKAEEGRDGSFWKGIIGSVIAWKILEHGREGRVSGGSDAGDAHAGRSVIDDLHGHIL